MMKMMMNEQSFIFIVFTIDKQWWWLKAYQYHTISSSHVFFLRWKFHIFGAKRNSSGYKTVEFQAGRTLRGFICSLSQPSLKFLEFLLVAPWSDRWLTNVYIGFLSFLRTSEIKYKTFNVFFYIIYKNMNRLREGFNKIL